MVLPSGKWAAIVVILALQAYLILAPNGGAGVTAGAPPGAAGPA